MAKAPRYNLIETANLFDLKIDFVVEIIERVVLCRALPCADCEFE